MQGYQLDTSRVPGKTIDTFDSANPPTFNFYYNKLSNTTTKVHYYNAKGWSYVNCYAYDDLGNEPLGAWANQGKRDKSLMKDDPDQSDSKWLVVDVPTSACYVMFHNVSQQVPDQGEPGYEVSGEAWIKDNVTSFNCSIVTSHIDLVTGEKLSPDVTKNYTNVRSNQTYTTQPDTSLNRNYVAPALANGFYQPGVLNVVYLYTDGAVHGDDLRYGDVDMDKYVTVMDVTYLQRALANIVSLTDDQRTVADVDASDSVGSIDVTYIQRWLAEMKVKGNLTNLIVGAAPVGEHTYEEFANAYNALNTLFAKYTPASKYASEPGYQQAQAALSTYAAIALNPSADPEDIDAGYAACTAAYAALSAVPIQDDGGDDENRESFLLTDNFGWGAAYVYAWDANGNPLNGEWPGASQAETQTNEYGETQFVCHIPEGAVGVILNNGNGAQTEDITDFTYDGYWMDGTKNDLGHYKVTGWRNGEGGDDPIPGPDPDPGFFLLTDNFGWGTAYVYAWDADGNPLNGEWPGAGMAETITNDYGETQFKCYVPEGAVGVILNNGQGAQTEDITDFSYTGYWMDGSKNDLGHYKVTGYN